MSNLEVNKIDLEQIKLILHRRLTDSGWGTILKTFILSNDMTKILEQLYSESRSGQKFAPVILQLLRAFEICSYDKLKVIVVGQDPYSYGPDPKTKLPVADGVAFSCSNKMYIPPSLKYMQAEIRETIYGGVYDHSGDLTDWGLQGVLLINSALTVTIGKIGTHYEMWKPFLTFLFDMLSKKEDLVYVFMGNVAQKWEGHVSSPNAAVLKCTHPASAAHNNNEKWHSGDIFNKIGEELEKRNKTKIIW